LLATIRYDRFSLDGLRQRKSADFVKTKVGLLVSPIALGTMQFGWSADEATSHSILSAYVDAGGNLIDTADVYSVWAPNNAAGVSEAIIRR